MFYNPPLRDPQIYADLLHPAKRLQMLCLSDCGLTIEATRQLLGQVRPEHHDISYIDLQGNLLGNELIDLFCEALSRYDLLEFIGLGNNKLSSLVRADQPGQAVPAFGCGGAARSGRRLRDQVQ